MRLINLEARLARLRQGGATDDTEVTIEVPGTDLTSVDFDREFTLGLEGGGAAELFIVVSHGAQLNHDAVLEPPYEDIAFRHPWP